MKTCECRRKEENNEAGRLRWWYLRNEETPVIRWGRGKGKGRKGHKLKMCHFSVESKSQQQSMWSWNILAEVGQLESQTAKLLHLLNGLSDHGFPAGALRSGCCKNSGAQCRWEGCSPDFCSISTLSHLAPVSSVQLSSSILCGHTPFLPLPQHKKGSPQDP